MAHDPYFWYEQTRFNDDELQLLFQAFRERSRGFEGALDVVLTAYVATLNEKEAEQFSDSWTQWKNDKYRSGEVMGRLIERAARNTDRLVERERKRVT